MAPVERIELPQADLEAAVLPLYYTGINLVVDQGFEPCRSSPSDQSPRVISASREPSPSTMCLLYGRNFWLSTVNYSN